MVEESQKRKIWIPGNRALYKTIRKVNPRVVEKRSPRGQPYSRYREQVDPDGNGGLLTLRKHGIKKNRAVINPVKSTLKCTSWLSTRFTFHSHRNAEYWVTQNL